MPGKRTLKRDIPDIDRALLIRLYHEQPLSVDKLPYTETFDQVVEQYNKRHTKDPSNHYWIYQTLVILRKNRKLIRKGLDQTPTLF